MSPERNRKLSPARYQIASERQAAPADGVELGMVSANNVSFQVHGLPVPQGSTRSWVVNGKPVITSAATGLSTWRRLVADVAQRYAPDEPWEGPVGIELHFGLPRPKSAPKRKRVWPDKRPDLDKLTRAVLDALTYVVFADDSQVVNIRATKDYGAPGVVVEIHRILDAEVSSQ
jgi:Holliday junction resolvase RusA-like endonuclease